MHNNSKKPECNKSDYQKLGFNMNKYQKEYKIKIKDEIINTNITEEKIQLFTVPIDERYDSNSKSNSSLSLSITELLDEYIIESSILILEQISKESTDFLYESKIYSIVPDIYNINKDNQKWLIMSENEVEEAKKKNIFMLVFNIYNKGQQYIEP